MKTCRRRTSLAVLTAILLAVLAATTGCRTESGPPEHGDLPAAADGSPPAPLISPVPAEETVELILFFPHAHEDRLARERRVTQTRGQRPEEVALDRTPPRPAPSGPSHRWRVRGKRHRGLPFPPT